VATIFPMEKRNTDEVKRQFLQKVLEERGRVRKKLSWGRGLREEHNLSVVHGRDLPFITGRRVVEAGGGCRLENSFLKKRVSLAGGSGATSFRSGQGVA